MSTTIKIRNIGPIKDVEITLNKVNVFMGPQSCGKSTIAKIVSFCSWFEKNAVLKGSLENEFYPNLVQFHNFEDNYFNEASYIEYQTEWSQIIYQDGNVTMKTQLGVGKPTFRNKKIEYIPAERNFVSVPGFGNYNETRDNIKAFLDDWFLYKQENTDQAQFNMPLTALHGSYYYTKDNNRDNILLEDGKTISLRHSSSGLMSVTPLLVVFNHVVEKLYMKPRGLSPFEIVHINTMIDKIQIEEPLKEQLRTLVSSINSLSPNISAEKRNELQGQLVSVLNISTDYAFSEVIIEEPELNLFPETQAQLLCYLLQKINNPAYQHQLILTTHSPYVLYALNNCILASEVKDKVDAEMQPDLSLYSQAGVKSSEVSIWEIRDGYIEGRNGRNSTIQDENGFIRKNFFNHIMKGIMVDFSNMLQYRESYE